MYSKAGIMLLDLDVKRLWNTLFNTYAGVRSGEEDNGLSGKCFTAPELAHQKSENVGRTPEPFPLLSEFR
jgi:hypothetical protein